MSINNPESRRALRLALGAALFVIGLALIFGAFTSVASPASWIAGTVFVVVGVAVLLGAL